MTRTRTVRRLAAALLALGLLAAACSEAGDDGGDDGLPDLGDPGDCIVVDLSVSPEKLDLLTRLAQDFNDSDAEVGGECVFARVQSKSSGGAAAAARRRVGRGARGPAPGDLVAGRVHVGRGAQPAARRARATRP